MCWRRTPWPACTELNAGCESRCRHPKADEPFARQLTPSCLQARHDNGETKKRCSSNPDMNYVQIFIIIIIMTDFNDMRWDQTSNLFELARQSMFYISCILFSCSLTPTRKLFPEIHGQHASQYRISEPRHEKTCLLHKRRNKGAVPCFPQSEQFNCCLHS